jgi:hypothetical protein
MNGFHSFTHLVYMLGVGYINRDISVSEQMWKYFSKLFLVPTRLMSNPIRFLHAFPDAFNLSLTIMSNALNVSEIL